MRRRYVLFGLTMLLAASLAVPAFGGPDNPVADTFASAKSTAKKALKKAREANKKAKQAQKSADNAQITADGAQSSADNAQATANAAQTAAGQAQTSADNAQASADAAQSTANSKFGSVDAVFGDSSPSDSTSSKLVFATCPTGSQITGGGFAINGAEGAVTPVLSSQYLNAWTARAVEIGAGTASNWSIQANVACISP